MTRVALLLACWTAGCALHRAPAWEAPGQPFGAVSDAIIDALESDGDRAWTGRRDPANVDAALQAWRAALRYRPASPSLLVRISQALRRRARPQPRDGALATLDQAVAHAERALAARNDKLRAHAADHRPPVEIFAAAEAEDLPALIAYCDALLAWSELGGTATLLAASEALRAAANRAISLDRRFQYGAPDRLAGTLAATLPLRAGGDLQPALDHFEAAVAVAPAYLPTRLLYAKRYALRLRDARLYRRLLQEVAAADPAALPDAAPENDEAQREARRLLRGG